MASVIALFDYLLLMFFLNFTAVFIVACYCRFTAVFCLALYSLYRPIHNLTHLPAQTLICTFFDLLKI